MSGSFKDFIISLSGSFPGYTQAKLKSIIESNGAKFSHTVTGDLTHLITSQREVDKNNSKFQQAFKVYNCSIVSLDWLVESDEAKKPLPEKSYILAPGTKNSKAKNDQNGDSKNEENKKRTLEEALELEEEGVNKKAKDGQKLGAKSLKIPVDEACYHAGNLSVYIDGAGLIYDATLNQTVAANNNNKFYRVQLLVDQSAGIYRTWTRWGRVGEQGQSAMLGNGSFELAMTEFEKKFKSKAGLSWENRLDAPKKGKYTFIEKNYEEEEDEEETGESGGKEKSELESTLPVPVQDLMSFIFNKNHFMSAMASMSYDAKKLPLGKLSKRTLRSGFQLLKDLSELLTTPGLATSRYGTSLQAATEGLSDQYFTMIPHVFGRNRPPVLSNEQLIKKELELLEALTDMEVADGIMKDTRDAETIHELDRQFKSLNMTEMTPLSRSSSEFKELETYLHRSRGDTHYLKYHKVINIFRIERDGENERFVSSKYAKIKGSNRRLLWHGSRSTNFGGILSQGLRIAPPEAPSTGYMFGKGVYFADMSSKSANYCCSGASANTGLLLLCDVELGPKMLEQRGGNYNAGEDAKKQGMIATLGQGTAVPGGWKDASCVHPNLQGVMMPDVATPIASSPGGYLQYNEYIVYDVAQIQQKYLFQVHMQ